MENFHTEAIPDPITPEKGRYGTARFIIDLLETLILSVVLFLAINAVSARIRVDGFSMEPTLHSGEFVIVNKLAYKLGEPAISDVIVFHYPRDPEQEYIKRVIGLPGERVTVADGQVFVDGTALDEPYLNQETEGSGGSWLVQPLHVFVMGDNRQASRDSRSFGTVSLDQIIGRALFRYWPLDQIGVVRLGMYARR